ncbi:WD repeat-containing protein 1 [Geodia barretti]|uniref:WD repeat-containing protein 1 n=2 Tax=Geodia barretti TaxID=519541 RepID=A0AA35U2L2_GEOBA|nr:WD repeat-containing protein 1 [Geodia barretti]
MGHSKFINSIDYRPSRPFRVATGGEDNKVCWFEGPPFRYKNTFTEHTRFVNCVRFSPDGALLCSVSSDGKAVVYDGSTGDTKGCLGGDKAHNGGIYAVAWGPDSKQLLTASGDKTCKLWDVTTCQVVSEFKMGTAVEDQQLGCLWQGTHLLSVSLSGFINFLDVNNPATPLRVVKGQNTNLNSLASASDTVYAGSLDGRISHWGVESGHVDLVSGQGHTNSVCCLQTTPDLLLSLGLDKNFKSTSLATNELAEGCLNLPGLDPTDMSVASDGTVVIATLTEVVLARGEKRVGSLKVNYQPQAVAAHPTLPELVVAGKDNSVHVYTLSGDSLTEKKSFQAGKEVVAAEFSPDGATLAISSGRSILLFDSASYQQTKDLLFHTAKIMAIAWSPDSAYIVSGSIDTNVIVWNAATGERDEIRGAHPLSVVTGVAWISNIVFASCGHDSCVRVWERSSA